MQRNTVPMHTEVIRVVAYWMAEEVYDCDEMGRFALTCKTAYETLKEELRCEQQFYLEEKENDAMESEDFDADTGRRWWSKEEEENAEAEADARQYMQWLRSEPWLADAHDDWY